MALLEATARELYREWFVRLRFPHHAQTPTENGLPKGWRLGMMREVINYYIGGGWGNDNPDSQFSEGGFVIRGTDIPNARKCIANKNIYRYHKPSNIASRKLQTGDIIFETAGGTEDQPLGRTLLITNELLEEYNDTIICASFCKMLRTTSISPFYLYFTLNYLYETREIETYQVQSTGISNYQFEDFMDNQSIRIPTENILIEFDKKVSNILSQIGVLGRQNALLRQTRDALLPRLLGGGLAVKA